MMPTLIVVFALLTLSQSAAAVKPAPIACTAAATDASVAEVCAGDADLSAADAMARASADRRARFESAAEHYRRAASGASKPDVRVRALEGLAQIYDAPRLDQPRQAESALRELIAQTPEDPKPVFRLAKWLEERGLIEAAEDALLEVRRQQPAAVEPYRMLAQFYARRVTALGNQSPLRAAAAPVAPGERDENGIYRIGGEIAPPSRLDVAKYPPEAAAAGIQGNVIAEIVIDEQGNVRDANVVRSIPLLDEAALQAVRNWHFTPTLVNGQSVPVRMAVTVNFTTR